MRIIESAAPFPVGRPLYFQYLLYDMSLYLYFMYRTLGKLQSTILRIRSSNARPRML